MRQLIDSVVIRALEQDGSPVGYRWVLTGFAGVASIAAGFLAEVPLTGIMMPSPVLSGWILLVAALAGAVDARAGFVAGVLGVFTAFAVSVSPSISGGLSMLGQMLVVVLLSSFVPLISRTAAWQATERIRSRSSQRVQRNVQIFGTAALTLLLVQGWLSALPVFAASVIPGAGFIETGAPANSAWLGPLVATGAAIRVAIVGLAEPRAEQGPSESSASRFIRGLPGAAVLVILVTSLYDGAQVQLIVVALVYLLIRAVHAGILPPPLVLLGGERRSLVLRASPVAVFLGALALALVLGVVAGTSPDRVRTAYLCLLLGLLVISRGPGGSIERMKLAATFSATTVAFVAIINGPVPAVGQSIDLSGVIGRSVEITYTWMISADEVDEFDVIIDSRGSYRLTITDAALEPEGLRLTVEGEYSEGNSQACLGDEGDRAGSANHEIVLLALPAPFHDLDLAVHPDRPYSDLQNAWYPLGTVTSDWYLVDPVEVTGGLDPATGISRFFGQCPRWYEGVFVETFSQTLDAVIPMAVLVDPAFSLSGILVRSNLVSQPPSMKQATRLGISFESGDGEGLDLARVASSLPQAPESPQATSPGPDLGADIEVAPVDSEIAPGVEILNQSLPAPPTGVAVPPLAGLISTSILLLGLGVASGSTGSAALQAGTETVGPEASEDPDAAPSYVARASSSEVGPAVGRPAIGLPEADIERILEGDAEGPGLRSD